MLKNKSLLIPLFLFLITLLFFYRLFLGLVPFPGDLLITEYTPWKQESFKGYVPGSFPHKAQYFDVIRQLYPWRMLAINQMKGGELPLWNPYNFSGTPLFANIQTAAFYPLNIFLFALSNIWGWSFLIILQPFLSSIFTFFYMRKIGVSLFGSLLSSIAFSYSLFSTTFLEYNTVGHVILWLPLILLSIENILNKEFGNLLISLKLKVKNLKFEVKIQNFIMWSLCLVFGIAASLLAGHLQIFGLIMVFIVFYIIFRIRFLNILSKHKIRLGLYVFFLILIGFGIGGIQLFPLFELINLSSRVSHDPTFFIDQLLLQPYQFIMIFIPDIFGNPVSRNYELLASYPTKAMYLGIPVLLFTIVAFFNIKKDRLILLFAMLLTFVLLYIVRTPVAELFFRINIPFFSSSSPSNGIFLLSFCLSVLAGIGFDIWNKEKKIFFPLLLLGVFAALFLTVTLLQGPTINLKNALYSSVLILIVVLSYILLSRFSLPKLLSIIFIAITIADLFYFFHKFNPFVPYEAVYPKSDIISFLQKNTGINRVWGYGSAYLEPNIHTQLRLYSTDGYDPLYLSEYGAFIQSSKDGKIHSEFNSTTRSNAAIAPGYGSGDLMNNPHRLKVLDSLGVRFILAKKEEVDSKTFPSDRFKNIYEKNNLIVFENLKAEPRTYLANNPSENAKIIEYKPNKVDIIINSAQASSLMLSDVFYPGWKAFIDDKETEIIKTNYIFRGVSFPAGKHNIKFIYEPASFYFGVKVSIISLVILVAALFLINRKKVLYE